MTQGEAVRLPPLPKKKMDVKVTLGGLICLSKNGKLSRIKRLTMSGSNGATGRFLWEYADCNPRFLGENMDEKQLAAARTMRAVINRVRVSEELPPEDFNLLDVLRAGGWSEFYPE